uniref:Uncharacterized protein n=1 Tax=Anguilla anguilla TaxID=7936 RepID=A0A0E9QNB5_ANGAN
MLSEQINDVLPGLYCSHVQVMFVLGDFCLQCCLLQGKRMFSRILSED